MSPFLRIGFSNFEIDPGLAYHEEVLNPYCAVYMKEAIDTGQFKIYYYNIIIFELIMDHMSPLPLSIKISRIWTLPSCTADLSRIPDTYTHPSNRRQGQPSIRMFQPFFITSNNSLKTNWAEELTPEQVGAWEEVPKLTETKNLYEVYSEFSVWSMSSLISLQWVVFRLMFCCFSLIYAHFSMHFMLLVTDKIVIQH